jgi:hypothetical protein
MQADASATDERKLNTPTIHLLTTFCDTILVRFTGTYFVIDTFLIRYFIPYLIQYRSIGSENL